MPCLSPKLALSLTLLLGFVGCSHVAGPALPPPPEAFPHEVSDLKPDAAVQWGRLANGLRYAILPHATPRQRASVHLLVQAGSFHERKSELGYAHFVEHMAFRDLRDFPGDGVFATLEKLGAGPHSSANTGPFETKYYFDHLPVNDADSLITGLKLMRAIADGIVFKPEGVERERGVILGEMRSRSAQLAGAGARSDELEFAPPRETPPSWPELGALLANTLLPRRSPIGEEKTLHGATAPKLQTFYQRWYRPERMILVVVGDIDPAALRTQIEATFSTLAGRGRPPATPTLAPPENPGRLIVHPSDVEPAIQVSMGVAHLRPGPDTVAARQRSLAQRLSLEMLARRLERAGDAPGASFFSSSTLQSHYVPGRELTLVRAGARPGEWRKTTSVIDFEVRRALMQGFTASEFEFAAKKESVHTSAAVRQASHRPSSELAAALTVSIPRGVVFTSPSEDHSLTATQLAALDEMQCRIAFRAMLGPNEWSTSLYGPVELAGGKPPDLDFKASRTAELIPYVPPTPPAPFPFTDFGPAGQVVKNERVAAIDTDTLQFANGVRLNLKQTPFEPGHLRIDIALGGGRLLCPPDKPGLDWRSFAWPFGGLEGLTREQQSAALADLEGGYSFAVQPTALSISGSIAAAHLPLFLQATAAHLARPAFTEEGALRSLEVSRQSAAPFASTADGVAHALIWHRMSSGHRAFLPPKLDEIGHRTVAELKAWLQPQLASGPLEVGIVGDFDPALATDAVARTLGALPARAPAASLAEQRRVVFPPKPFAETVQFQGTKGVAVIMLAWPVADAPRYPAYFHAHIAAAILESRVTQKLRSEMGETYSPGVALATNDSFTPSVAFLRCTVEAMPERATQVAAAAREVAATLVREGATAEEFERARRPLVRTTETGLRHNGWWSDVVIAAQSDPAYGEGWTGALATYETATLDQINSALRRWLAPERLCELVVQPAK